MNCYPHSTDLYNWYNHIDFQAEGHRGLDWGTAGGALSASTPGAPGEARGAVSRSGKHILDGDRPTVLSYCLLQKSSAV